MTDDLGIGSMAISLARLRLIEFFPALRQNVMMMTTARPKVVASFETLFSPFDLHVWMFTGGVTVAFTLTLIGLTRLWKSIHTQPARGSPQFEGIVLSYDYT